MGSNKENQAESIATSRTHLSRKETGTTDLKKENIKNRDLWGNHWVTEPRARVAGVAK